MSSLYSQIVEGLNQLRKQNAFEPLHILYKISRLKKKKKILADKLRKLGKQIKHSSPNELQLRFKALKELSSETIQTIKELELKIPSSYNFSHLTETLERSKRELENIRERETNFEPTPQDKARKYELLQTQEEYIRVIQHVQQSAREYFLKLKEHSFLLEQERINLREKRFKRYIAKNDYKDKIRVLQEIIQYITRVLTFLNRSILSYRYE